MRHYRIFGNSLRKGVRRVGQADIVVHAIGILFYSCFLTSDFYDIVDELTPALENSTELFPISNIPVWHNTTCVLQDGKLETPTLACILEILVGTVGIIIHVLELLMAAITLKYGKEYDVSKCTWWIRLSMALSTLEAVLVIASQVVHLNSKLLSFILLNAMYKGYSISLVKAYTSQLKDVQPLPSTSTSNRRRSH